MIKLLTNLSIVDNSGASFVKCIKILKGSTPNYGKIGDLIVVTVQKLSKNSKLKKGDIYNALIIGTLKKYRRSNGTFINFNNNYALLLNKDNTLVGTRIFSAIPYEINKNKYSMVYSHAPTII